MHTFCADQDNGRKEAKERGISTNEEGTSSVKYGWSRPLLVVKCPLKNMSQSLGGPFSKKKVTEKTVEVGIRREDEGRLVEEEERKERERKRKGKGKEKKKEIGTTRDAPS